MLTGMDAERDRQALGAQLRAARGYAGKHLTEMAEEIGVAPETLRRWEAGGIPHLPGREEWIVRTMEEATSYPVERMTELLGGQE